MAERPIRGITQCRSGFTVIELLIVVGICSLLMALLIPAVQNSREAARRVACSNQLRQLVLAANHYESAFGGFPTHSFFRQIRTFAEISDQTDKAAIFACPSDGQATGDLNASRISYATNDGLGARGSAYAGVIPERGATLRAADITDGLSNTACIAERLSFPWYAPQNVAWDERPQDWKRTFLYFKSTPKSPDEFRQACRAQENRPVATWLFMTEYHHLLPPNSNSCVRIAQDSIAIGDFSIGASAGSVHSGGALCGFCDGSVSFVSNSVAITVWQAQGTRAAGDAF